MTAKMRSPAGFTLLEVLISTVIVLTVTAAVFSVLDPARGMFQVQPEMADIQQRLRVGVDALTHDLAMAGAGAYVGPQSGGLIGHFAPILPFRQGRMAAYDDGPGVFRPGAITIMYVPSTAAQTTIHGGMTAAASTIAVNAEPGCPLEGASVDPLCGFSPDTTNVLVYDTTGSFDTFVVTSADAAGGQLTLQHTLQGSSHAYPDRARIVEAVRHVYYFDAANQQLMHYDGLSTATAVLDNVVGLDFEYYGEPRVPAFRLPGRDQTVTYGPAPPAPGVTQSPWAAGENCTWQMSAGQQVARLEPLGAAGAVGLVRLTSAQLTDGPWCPDPGSANRYDADLLRIRKVRVTLRLQTGNAALRGSLATGNAALFVNPGTARNAARTVSDQAIRFDVSPRNMNLGR
jgi:prepilin-type N-terminal cleavage/methylation domain-containing protein